MSRKRDWSRDAYWRRSSADIDDFRCRYDCREFDQRSGIELRVSRWERRRRRTNSQVPNAVTELRSRSASSHSGVTHGAANTRGQSTGLAAYARALSRATLMVLSAGCAGAHVSNAPSASTQSSTQGAVTPGAGGNGALSGVAGGSQMTSGLPGCPGGNGIRISATSGTGSDSGSVLNTVVNERQSIDTTMVFDVALKNWTRTNLAAEISVGLSDQTRGGYAICAGVSALIPSATLTIKGARGRVHFAATLKDLLNSIRSGPGGTSPQLRRM